ncbi:MAG: exodeoxyribonuclease V subunit alpha [SAR324 cluster bacterium]|nr:exodeoxyribonuclease V subunit alpha [SAR324 cluster bacterium]
MKNTTLFTPAGTARTLFGESLLPIDEQIHPSVPSKELTPLLSYCQTLGLENDFFYQALDLIYWGQNDFSEKEQASLVALILLSHHFLLSGNTCLPLKKNNDSILSHLFEESGLDTDGAKEYDSLLQTLLTNKKLNWLFGSPTEFKPFIVSKNRQYLYHQKSFLNEQIFIRFFKKRLQWLPESPSTFLVQQILHEILEQHPVRMLDENPVQFSEEQQLALLVAIQSPITIISGGPGTGKTSIVVMILRLLIRLGMAQQIALAAPTGRAAKRMAESIMASLQSIHKENGQHPDQLLMEQLPEPQTLHRLLGFSPISKKFKYHENNPLEQDIVVIDEVSMIDLELMAKLIKAVTPSDPSWKAPARLILLGDANQLPSVGAGAVLMDLVPEHPSLHSFQQSLLEQYATHLAPLIAHYTQAPPTLLSGRVVCLTRSYRQRKEDPLGRNILGVAQKVNKMAEEQQEFKMLLEGKDEGIAPITSIHQFPQQKVHFLCQENSLNQMEELVAFWIQWYFANPHWKELSQRAYSLERMPEEEPLMQELFDYYSRCRVLSFMKISHTGTEILNQMFQQQLGRGATGYYPGAFVMVQRNDYENALFNGDEGVCLLFENTKTQREELKIVFPSEHGYRTFYPHQLPNIQLSYAMTVHKSQGSEYEHVAIVLPAESNTLLFKEMVYTAITRAKKSVLILGPSEILKEAVFRKIQRFSGISAFLSSQDEMKSKIITTGE